MDAEQALMSIGFTEQEKNIYLYLLRKGAQTQQSISDGTNILRQTIYDLMKKMESKGYVSTSLEGKRTMYLAINPDLLLEQIKEKEELFMQALPELQSLAQQQKVQISSQTFIGKKGLKNLFNMTLNATTPIMWLSNKKIHDTIFNEFFWHNYAKKRDERRIPIQLIIEPTKDKGWKTDPKIRRETKTHPYVTNLETSLVIFDDNVILYTTQEEQLFGLFIRNEFMKEFFKAMFIRLWEEAKEQK